MVLDDGALSDVDGDINVLAAAAAQSVGVSEPSPSVQTGGAATGDTASTHPGVTRPTVSRGPPSHSTTTGRSGTGGSGSGGSGTQSRVRQTAGEFFTPSSLGSYTIPKKIVNSEKFPKENTDPPSQTTFLQLCT